MNEKDTKYQEFIRYSISEDGMVPDSAKSIDWKDFYEFCYSHGILGVVYYGIVRSGLVIPRQVLLDWCRAVSSIRAINRQVDECIGTVVNLCDEWNYKSCILKGQANAQMYPHPNLRSPGDIDIWLDGERNEIIEKVRGKFPEAHFSIHHVKMPMFRNVQVEVHYRPIYLDNWKTDKRLQSYIDEIKESQFENRIILEGKTTGTLTDDFNAVYQLLHMWHHFFSTRNNFKQFIDYYYLLKRGFSAEGRQKCQELFERFEVVRYAKGIMWIQKEVLGIPENRLITEPDERVGKLILEETMRYSPNDGDGMSYVRRLFIDNYRFLRLFPSEVAVKPFFLIWHQWWKLKTKCRICS